jgi:hypothetical protein
MFKKGSVKYRSAQPHDPARFGSASGQPLHAQIIIIIIIKLPN